MVPTLPISRNGPRRKLRTVVATALQCEGKQRQSDSLSIGGIK